MRLSSGIVILPTMIAAVAPAAMATVYLSPDQALAVIFTDHKAADFKASTLKLTGEQRKAVTSSTGLGGGVCAWPAEPYEQATAATAMQTAPI